MLPNDLCAQVDVSDANFQTVEGDCIGWTDEGNHGVLSYDFDASHFVCQGFALGGIVSCSEMQKYPGLYSIAIESGERMYCVKCQGGKFMLRSCTVIAKLCHVVW